MDDAIDGEGPFADREEALAEVVAKATIPDTGEDDEDTIRQLRELRTRLAEAVRGLEGKPGTYDDRQLGVIESLDAQIRENAVCHDAARSTETRAAVAPTTTAPCPSKPVQVTVPTGWRMVRDVAGKQTWEASGSVSNPNNVDVQLTPGRNIALVTVTRQDGSTYEAYTDALGGGDTVPAGGTVEVTTKVEVSRPASITTAEVYADAQTPGRTCQVTVEGAKPAAAARSGPQLCWALAGPQDPQLAAAIGRRNPGDWQSCR